MIPLIDSRFIYPIFRSQLTKTAITLELLRNRIQVSHVRVRASKTIQSSDFESHTKAR